MVLSALSSGDTDKRADVIAHLGRGIADMVAALKSKKDVDALLEVVIECIRSNVEISYQQYKKAAEGLEAAKNPEPTPEHDGESMTAVEFLDKHFKPEKFDA